MFNVAIIMLDLNIMMLHVVTISSILTQLCYILADIILQGGRSVAQ